MKSTTINFPAMAGLPKFDLRYYMARKRNKGIARFIRSNLPKLVSAIAYAQTDSTATGSEKLESASKWLNDKIDIPLLPEYIEQQIFKVALTSIVELAKSIWGDNEWFEKLIEIVGLDD